MSDCPDCHRSLREKALTDSDHRIYAKWRYCGNCGWDERLATSPDLDRQPERVKPNKPFTRRIAGK